MRLVSVLALMTSSLALAACGGGGGGGAMNLLNGGNAVGGTKDTAAAIVAANRFSVCGIDQTGCIPITGGDGSVVTVKDSDGDGVPDGEDGNDGDGDTGSGAGGNTTTYVAGNKTIALEKFVLDKPTNPKVPAISQVTALATPTFAATENAILSVNKPKSLKYTIDTKSTHNSFWAVPEEMPESIVHTRDLRWIGYGHTTVNMNVPANYNIVDTQGNPVRWDATKGRLIYTVPHTTADASFNAGDIVDHKEDFYWNQLTTYMGSKANGGSKGNYREYWNKNSDPANTRDEELQVWAWKDSYAVKYQNGLEPKQQAWSFGGKATQVMAAGKSRYGGRFVGSAKTEGWKQLTNSDINPNASWMVQGRTDIIADIDNSTIKGTLSPESWTSEQKDGVLYTWYTQEAARVTPGNITRPASVGTAAAPDYYQIYGSKVTIDGTIVANGTGTTAVKNVFEGTATLTGDFKSTDNPVYGGFFGTDRDEVTGIFNVAGTVKDPVGGSTGNVNQKEATISINGAFNGACQVSPGYTCPP